MANMGEKEVEEAANPARTPPEQKRQQEADSGDFEKKAAFSSHTSNLPIAIDNSAGEMASSTFSGGTELLSAKQNISTKGEDNTNSANLSSQRAMAGEHDSTQIPNQEIVKKTTVNESLREAPENQQQRTTSPGGHHDYQSTYLTPQIEQLELPSPNPNLEHVSEASNVPLPRETADIIPHNASGPGQETTPMDLDMENADTTDHHSNIEHQQQPSMYMFGQSSAASANLTGGYSNPNVSAQSIAAPSVNSNSVSNPELEVDSAYDNSDADSAIGSDRIQSSTNSARSSVFDFVEENGRTFHRYKEGKYVLPNDAIEQDRLDLQHHMLLIMLDGRLHLAPINPNLQNVLDVGTGTGIWAIEFAQQYPSAMVIGSDLSPIQPEYVPPNCQFEVDDAEDTWMYSKPFDYIHMRGMMTCFSSPRTILAKAYDALLPGGYLEMQDSVFPMHCHDSSLAGTALDVWGRACVEAAAKIGRPWTNTPHYRRWMEELGFEEVREKIFEVPTSTWPKGAKQKELGLWWQADLMEALGASMRVLIHGLGWSKERVEVLLVDVRKDIKNRGVHAYMPIHVVWGRKPYPK